MNRYTCKIGGPAGYGIKATGQILAKSLKRSNYSVFAFYEYPSLVRGGHNTCNITFSNNEIYSGDDKINLLVAFDDLTLKMDSKYLSEKSILLCDTKIVEKAKKSKKYAVINIPLTELALELGKKIIKNTIALGAVSAILGLNKKTVFSIMQNTYSKLPKEVIDLNKKAWQIGYNYIVDNYKDYKSYTLKTYSLEVNPKKQFKNNLFIDGNEATSLGLIIGKCNYYAAYPMTPSTTILHYLHKEQKKINMLVHQCEDEISGALNILGASYAGARSALGTSGGGFALMNEALSYAGIAEIGAVFINVMRPGPATGLPTWTEQGDLAYVLKAGHGDFPKVVLAIGDPSEAIAVTIKALNIASKYQVPVIVLSDKHLGESFFTYKFDEKLLKSKIENSITNKVKNNYLRYEFSKNKIIKRSIPGIKNGEFIANSDEHDEYGYSIEATDGNNRVRQMKQRMNKLKNISKEMSVPKIYGPKNAKLTIIGWGSTKGTIIDAINEINVKNKKKVNYLHFTDIFPLDKTKVNKVLKQCNKFFLVENNYSGQLGEYLQNEFRIEFLSKFLKYDGRQIFADEIISKIIKFCK